MVLAVALGAALAVARRNDADVAGQQPSSRRPWRLGRSIRWPRPSWTRSPAGPNGPPRVVRGAARSLLVTPWFAAGTGFVIATALWIYSPHTELKFPDSAPGYSLCQSEVCLNNSPGPGGGSLANSLPGEKINGPQAKTSGTGKPDVITRAASGLKFRFVVLWQQGSHFYAVVTVSGHSVPSSWRLSFAIPGVRIDHVIGVSWRPSRSGNGGTVSAPSWQYGSSSGQDAANGTGADDSGSHGHRDVPVISFIVTGTGSVGLPTTCRFDGSTCKFR